MVEPGNNGAVSIGGAARRAMRRIRWRERLIGSAARLLRCGAEEAAAWQRGAIILLYHRIVDPGESVGDPFAVERRAFAEQVHELAKRFTLVSVAQLVERLEAGEDVARFAAISFDDGYDCTYLQALPILREAGIPATVFLDTGRIDAGGDGLTSEQVRALVEQGWEIGSHTVSHGSAVEISEEDWKRELRESRMTLEGITGRPVQGFAYPFGRYDVRAVEAVRATGYRYACTCRQHRTNHPGDDPFLLTRLEINRADTLKRVRRKVAGQYARVYAAWYRLNPATRAWVDDPLKRIGSLKNE